MKKFFSLFLLLAMTTILMAQAPQKFTYQAVVRDAIGKTLTTAPVGVRVSILKASADGVTVYCETHVQNTNVNGLLSLEIGGGTVVGGDFSTIDWANGPYFLKTETDIAGGTNYTIVATQQLLSVPYALYAGNTVNGFSGDYNDLSNKPEIPEVPSKVSAFENDAKYITDVEFLEQLKKLQKQLDSLKQNGGGGNGDTTATAQLPMVITTGVSNVKYNSGQCSYSVVDMNTYVTARGVCWSTSHNPTIEDAHTNDGTLAGNFTSTMSVLRHKTTYYVRAYASNSDGTAYGEEKSFTTGTCPLPSVSIQSLMWNGGVLTGECSCSVSDKVYDVTDRGICWSTSSNPTLQDNHVSSGAGSGAYTSTVNNLKAETVYYFRAYCTNEGGTTYSSELQRYYNPNDGTSCKGAATLTDIDGNTYNTVQIGKQCWMKENLKTTKYADGTSIEQGSPYSDDVAYWYYPNNNSSNKATYGLLYNWNAVMGNSSSSSTNPSNVQGICPTGWHVPSDAEWTQLTDYVGQHSEYTCSGSSSNIAKALASTEGWISSTTNCAVGNTPDSNNATGFSVFPAGSYTNAGYNYFGNLATFWCAAKNNSSYAYGRYLGYSGAYVYRDYGGKDSGFSVRCLRDL